MDCGGDKHIGDLNCHMTVGPKPPKKRLCIDNDPSPRRSKRDVFLVAKLKMLIDDPENYENVRHTVLVTDRSVILCGLREIRATEEQCAWVMEILFPSARRKWQALEFD